MSNPALGELFASYVPRLIQKRVIVNPSPIESPIAENFQAAVLFADISGFTLLTERLAERGLTGVETLARDPQQILWAIDRHHPRIWRGCGQGTDRAG